MAEWGLLAARPGFRRVLLGVGAEGRQEEGGLAGGCGLQICSCPRAVGEITGVNPGSEVLGSPTAYSPASFTICDLALTF